MFAVFSLWLFRLTDQKKEDVPRHKRLRNHLYLVFGIAIVVGAALVAYKLKTETTGNPDVLLPECVVISAFAASWLVKGGAIARWLPD